MIIQWNGKQCNNSKIYIFLKKYFNIFITDFLPVVLCELAPGVIELS